MSEAQRVWMKEAFGIEIPIGAGEEDETEAPDGEGPRKFAKGGKGGKGKGEGNGADGTAKPTAPVAKPSSPPPSGATPTPPTAPAPGDPDVDAAIKAFRDEAEAIKKLGFDTKRMESDAADFAKAAEAAKKQADAKTRQDALAAIKKRAEEALEHAKALSASFKSIMGDKKDKPDSAQKSAIYKKALEDLYGLKIKVPKGFKNTHFDRVFDMFGTVPKGHVKQDQLKKLTYSKKAEDKGSGAFGSTEIEMGDFGKAKDKEDYQIDGKKIPANSFDVTTLHEIGHSVDEKNGIMTKNQAKPGCGGWKNENVASVTTIFLAELKKTAKPSKKVTDAMLKDVVAAALRDGTTDQPDKIADDDWQKIINFLVDKCLAIRSDADPWFADSQVVIGDRVYQEAYDNDWWSYAFAARATTRVNDYQWRSPAEWFAEVYAISWLSKKKPPSGVDPAVVEFMWKG